MKIVLTILIINGWMNISIGDHFVAGRFDTYEQCVAEGERFLESIRYNRTSYNFTCAEEPKK